jgi:hypothetical protein
VPVCDGGAAEAAFVALPAVVASAANSITPTRHPALALHCGGGGGNPNHNTGARVDVEIMLSPLPAFWSRGDRFLGHAAAVADGADQIVTRLTIGALLTPAGPLSTRPRPHLRLVVSNA